MARPLRARTVQPMTTARMTGRAGKFSRRMQLASYLRAAGWCAAALPAAAGAITLLAKGGFQWAGVLALVAAACVWGARQHLSRAAKQGVGASSERQVSDALRSSGAYRVVNNATLPGTRGDADHVVFTPRGVALVETKAGGGQVRVNSAGRLVTGQARVVPGDPVGQALGQADALARLTGQGVTTIVCVPWMANPSFSSRGVVICSAASLPSVLRRMPGRMTEQAANRAAAQLRR